MRALPLALALALVVGCRSTTDEPDDRGPIVAAPVERAEPRSLEALVAELRALEQAGRYAEVYELLPPADREGTLYVAWFGAAYTAIGDDAEKRDDYAALVAEHALDEAWLNEDATGPEGVRGVARRAFAGRDDLPAVFGDLVAYQETHGRFGVAFGFDHDAGAPRVEGDRATVEVGPGEFDFVRRDGAWYWSFVSLDRD